MTRSRRDRGPALPHLRVRTAVFGLRMLALAGVSWVVAADSDAMAWSFPLREGDLMQFRSWVWMAALCVTGIAVATTGTVAAMVLRIRRSAWQPQQRAAPRCVTPSLGLRSLVVVGALMLAGWAAFARGSVAAAIRSTDAEISGLTRAWLHWPLTTLQWLGLTAFGVTWILAAAAMQRSAASESRKHRHG